MNPSDRADKLIKNWKEQWGPITQLSNLDELCLYRAIRRNIEEALETANVSSLNIIKK